MKRPPLWTTLIPLVVAGAAYYQWWSAQRDAFVADVAAIFGVEGSSGGFPYRIETGIAKPALGFDRAGAVASVSADLIVLNRQTLGEGPVVGQMLQPRLMLAVPAISDAGVNIEARTSSSSLRIANGHVVRFSTVFDAARLRFARLATAATADRFEAHFRETPAVAVASSDPRFPVQDELVLAATGLRYGKGDPLSFAASLDLTAKRPVRSFADWRTGGTVEVRRFQLSDRVGDVLTLTATASPGSDGQMFSAGTVDTVCPATVEAAFAGETGARELRARRVIRYAFAGPLGRLRLTPLGVTRVPVRNQEPPCPVLRR